MKYIAQTACGAQKLQEKDGKNLTLKILHN